MRILIAHNMYQQSGGEDVVFRNEGELLRAHGHAVETLTVHNDAIQGLGARVRTALQVPYSEGGRGRLGSAIAAFRPDVVHVHNFFPLLTPAIYDACRDAGVAVVQTLSNYRLVCAGAYLLRDGRICKDCIGASPYQAVLHGCYRGSRLGSLAVARMIDVHRRRNTWNTKIDRLVALTAFGKSKFVAAGIDPDKIAVKPNFVPDPGEPDAAADAHRAGALFVGRLSPEKGIATLLKAWRSLDIALTIAGDGTLRPMAEWAAGGTIRCVGHLGAERVREAIRSAAFLVMPSQWYEGFPVVIAEAFANGLPVIASRLGAMAELIGDGQTGLLFTPGDAADLADKVRWATAHAEEMRASGRRARQMYEAKYTPEVNYHLLIDIYKAAIAERLGEVRPDAPPRAKEIESPENALSPDNFPATGGEEPR